MKLFIAFIALLTAHAYAWETSDCQGTQSQRIEALKKLGAFTLQYKSIHGDFPNMMDGGHEDFAAGIPKELKGYLISKDDSLESIDFICNIPKPKKPGTQELCSFYLQSNKAECLILAPTLKFVPDPLPK